MKYGVIELSRQRIRKLHRRAAKTRGAALRTRYMILVHSARGLGRAAVAERLGCSEATVRRARQLTKATANSVCTIGVKTTAIAGSMMIISKRRARCFSHARENMGIVDQHGRCTCSLRH